MTDQVFGQQSVGTQANDYNELVFVFNQLLQSVQTLTLVKVLSVTNSGGVAPVGMVSVQPMVNQMTGNRIAVPHGPIYNIPYMRVQGGTNAIILDPEIGDIGLMGCCSRDISAVKNAKAASNPGSFRTFDWADGLYIGGYLNGTPTQYVRFEAGGIDIVSPTKITLTAPVVDIEASTSVTINSPANTIEGGGTSIDGKPFLPHVHSGVQSGGSDTGGVV